MTLNFDQNRQLTAGISSVGASANISGLNLGEIEAAGTVEMVSGGQLHVNPLSVTKTRSPAIRGHQATLLHA